MKCISSPALDDTQIISFVEGEADDVIVAHIQECQYCREKAQRWTFLQNRLRMSFYRRICPSPMELGDYRLGYLPSPQTLVVSQHLRDCLLCRQEVAALDDFLASLAPEAGWLGTAKVLMTRLIGASSENNPGSAAPALRGQAKGPLTFEADDIAIVLDIQLANQGSANIFGQIATDHPEQWTGALVELRQGSQLEFSATLDDLGTFQSESISPGSKELRIIPRDHSLIIISIFEVSV